MGSRIRRALQIGAIVGLALCMSACGGAGGSGGETGQPDGGNPQWNEMVWNRGSWGP